MVNPWRQKTKLKPRMGRKQARTQPKEHPGIYGEEIKRFQ
jgi:hypothetical protein